MLLTKTQKRYKINTVLEDVSVNKINNRGQALVEYLLIIAVISVIVVSLVKLLGGYLQDAVTKSSCEVMNKTYVEGAKPGEGTCE
jgi:Flp pilus assembly pilin Flp